MGKRQRHETSTGKVDGARATPNNMKTKKRKGFGENHADSSKKNTPPPTKDTADPTKPQGETWSKSKKKRMRMLLAKQKKNEPGKASKETTEGTTASDIPAPGDASGSNPVSKLQNAFKARLTGSRFRILNEELYTKTSDESFKRFSQNPELFEQYHEGFRHQVESWPVNPVDVVVKWLSNKYRQSPCVVADFGCGDAQLAKDLLKISHKGKCPFTIHSFDLISPNELVTACDMAHVPLKDKSVDVCVFCLSLMGTNLADFIREAHRVLKDNGVVKIAEVRSRVDYSHSKLSSSSGHEHHDTTKKTGTLSEFLDVLEALGFKCTKKDLSNKMFLVLDLEKTGKAPDKKLEFSAKPCIYKRR